MCRFICIIYMLPKRWNLKFTCHFCYGEPHAYWRIRKRHDGCEYGEPRELVKVWYLAQNYLDASKYYHEWVVWYGAVVLMAVFVETIWPLHRPNHFPTQKKKKKPRNYYVLVNIVCIIIYNIKVFYGVEKIKDQLYLHHANRGSDSVTDGNSNKITILSQPTELYFSTTCIPTNKS